VTIFTKASSNQGENQPVSTTATISTVFRWKRQQLVDGTFCTQVKRHVVLFLLLDL